jgi:hypothetical protein
MTKTLWVWTWARMTQTNHSPSSLRAAAPGRWPQRQVASGSSPPTAGMIAHFTRGSMAPTWPFWDAKASSQTLAWRGKRIAIVIIAMAAIRKIAEARNARSAP